MRYRIAAVGRRARDPLLDSADRYLERLCRYVPTELLLVRERSKDDEASQLLTKIDGDDICVLLDEHGKDLTTAAFAEFLRAFAEGPKQRVCFVLGGADGHGEAMRSRANHSLRLSSMTLPHRMALALLTEQLYRAHTILRGERYHRV